MVTLNESTINETMTQKIIYYLLLALLLVAVPMALAWLLPVRLMVGVLAVTQLLTLIIVGAVIQDLKPRRDHEQE
jgi:NADH:ubiquinone oxidoreductase subunit 3 (subunit A)